MCIRDRYSNTQSSSRNTGRCEHLQINFVRRTSAYSIVIRSNISGPGTLLWKHTRYPTKEMEKKTVHQERKKRKAIRASNPRPHYLRDCKVLFNHPFSYMSRIRLTCICTYEFTCEISWPKNESSPPHRETTRARPRRSPVESGETSTVRHIEQTPHRMVDLISSYEAFTAQNLV